MRKAAGWIVGGLALVAFTALALRRYEPPLRGVIELGVTFASTHATEGEPLVVTGETGGGDFIYVKYLDATTVAFGYDRWGVGGPVSAPVTVQPGQRYALRIESPSLVEARAPLARGPERLRVWWNNAAVLDAPARSEPHLSGHAWVGENPIGGSTSGPRFSGELNRRDGQVIRGSTQQLFSASDRVVDWLNFRRWQVFAVLLGSVAAGGVTTVLARRRGAAWSEWLARGRAALGEHRVFLGTLAVSATAFGWVVTGGSGQFVFPENFADFFDHQAASLLQGRLDVPESVLRGEAFIFEGKCYGYFGITPSLLRLPFVIFEAGFGELSRSLMLCDYVAALIAAYAILREATRWLRGAGARPSSWSIGVVTVSAGLGSTLFFLGSRAYIYHEAILCGAAFALWSVWFSLRHLAAPAGGAWIGALACGVAAVHARPSSGLFALSVLVAAALVQLWDNRRERRWHRPAAISALAAAGVLSFNGLSYLKFKTIDGCPLRYNVQYDPVRLARIDGRQFHLSNLPFNAYAYLAHLNFHFEARCPFVFMGSKQRPLYFPSAKIDLADTVLPMPYAMPHLFWLATLGALAAAWFAPATRRPLAVLWLAAVPMTLAMFAAIACSHRYTGDFCPLLIASAALAGTALDEASGRWHGALRALSWVLVFAGVLITGALTLDYQGTGVWGVPPEVQANYHRWCERVDKFLGLTHG